VHPVVVQLRIVLVPEFIEFGLAEKESMLQAVSACALGIPPKKRAVRPNNEPNMRIAALFFMVILYHL